MNDVTAIAILVLLLLGNGFFVASEFAMVSARRDHLEPRAAEGSLRARWSLRGLENVSGSLAATQLGITACSLLIGAVGEPAIAHLIAKPLDAVGVPRGFVHPIALVIALLIVTFLHMVLGEMVPKNMAIARPAAAALLLGPVLRVFVLVFLPAIWLMNQTANLVVRYVCRVQPRDEVETTFTVDQMLGMVEASGDEGLLDEDEATLLAGALAFDHITASDVARPLAEVDTVEAGWTTGEVQELCVRTGHSRFPVRAADGGFAGYVHVKDIVSDDPAEPLRDERIRVIGEVLPTTPLDDVLSAMQGARAHLAIVGGGGEPEGVVALGDVLARLVGEVRDVTPSR
ncbi:hemolysin family protein [Dietzia sp. 179-F 9C3 NHS]|uniref:hemolysin family protein n=1 Tax=Dietzia sp. 179-F 9C3 NHS TaxID=3374295 RepID=UPI00387A5750